MSSSTLFVEKLGKQVQIIFDTKSLRIQSDATAIVPQQKKSKKSSRSCVCLPTLEANDDPSSSPASSSLPIPHRNILHANYNARTNMVQLNALVADKPSDPESTAQLFKFMYTVRDNEQEKATEFCQNIMASVYQGKLSVHVSSGTIPIERAVSRSDTREASVGPDQSVWRSSKSQIHL